ncbi:hypothetical protein SRABI118_03548 [Massilia sp. Bi118]|uniref:hypothetical protein n=1 Tax=Massilia sp. Bi118 TaxID=2822346 RepID=UPI001D2FC277|nr:hypothetical protein [Massilia sp. Bi118]CAH0273160.1 hypothetical protein SRABI118_03548 [Massilia sp. Bi118]
MNMVLLIFLSVILLVLLLVFLLRRPIKEQPPSEIVLTGDNGPLLQLSLDDDQTEEIEPLQLSPGLSSKLGMIVAPGVGVLSSLYTGVTAFKVVFKPEVAEGLANGSLTLMQGDKGSYLTAVQRLPDGTRPVGQIAGNGQVVADTAARAAALAAAAFQVASIITAQKFLADIDKKLGSIAATVDEIQRWNEAAVFNALRANYRYLSEIADSLHEGKLGTAEQSAYINQIDFIERESVTTAGICRDKLSDYVMPPLSTSWTESGIDEDISELKKVENAITRFVRGYFAAQQVRMLAAQLRGALPIDRAISLKRLSSIENDLLDAQSVWEDMVGRLKRHAESVKYSYLAGLVKTEKDKTEREKFNTNVDRASCDLLKARDEIISGCCQLKTLVMAMDVEKRAGIKLRVTLDETGKVVTAARCL